MDYGFEPTNTPRTDRSVEFLVLFYSLFCMDYHLAFLLMKIHSTVGSHIPDNKLSKCCLLPPKYFHEVVIWGSQGKGIQLQWQ